jgi:serine/threonine-protein kinase RsbT
MKIDCEDDVVLVRRAVKSIAEKSGFGPFAVAAVTTATSELTRNVWQYARKGTATIEVVSEAGRTGLRIRFDDSGPGIAELERVLEGGYTTNQSLGIGVSGSRRLVDEFDIQTERGRGTTVTVLKWMRPS